MLAWTIRRTNSWMAVICTLIYQYHITSNFKWESSIKALHPVAVSVALLWLYHYFHAWWRHQMEAFSALLVRCAGHSPVTGEFPSPRPMRICSNVKSSNLRFIALIASMIFHDAMMRYDNWATYLAANAGTTTLEPVHEILMGLLPGTLKWVLRMRRECRERFPRHCWLAIPICITTRASRTCRDALRDRYLTISFEVGGGENVPGIPGACAAPNFAYLVRGPCRSSNESWWLIKRYDIS